MGASDPTDPRVQPMGNAADSEVFFLMWGPVPALIWTYGILWNPMGEYAIKIIKVGTTQHQTYGMIVSATVNTLTH